jgi:hypothetical protein
MDQPETEIIELNMGDIKITFLDPHGDPLPRGEMAFGHRAIVDIPGLDSKRIKRVEFDDIDYSDISPYTIRVELYTADFLMDGGIYDREVG